MCGNFRLFDFWHKPITGSTVRGLRGQGFKTFLAMEVRKVIGWNIRTLRVERGIAQEKLALESGIDRAYMGRVERGEENVTIARLEAVASVLDVPVAAFFREPQKGHTVPALKPGVKPKKKVRRAST